MYAWRLPRRLFAAAVVSVCLFLGGCSVFPDLFPSFSHNRLAPQVEGDNIPIAEVVNSVQCEVAAFLSDEIGRRNFADSPYFRLKNDGFTTVTLSINTTFDGGVSYTQLDLTKSSLLALFLVDDGKSYPHFDVTGTSENSAEIKVRITQDRAAAKVMFDNCYENLANNKYHPKKDVPLANGSNVFSYEDLGLTTWLRGFSGNTNGILKSEYTVPKPPETCPKKCLAKPAAGAPKSEPYAQLDTITLTTKFGIEVDFGSSVKRFIRIVPLANYPVANIDPKTAHTLKIQFDGYGKTKGGSNDGDGDGGGGRGGRGR